MSACGGLYPLDAVSLTPASIRGLGEGDDTRPPARIPKLIDNLEQLLRNGLKIVRKHVRVSSRGRFYSPILPEFAADRFQRSALSGVSRFAT